LQKWYCTVCLCKNRLDCRNWKKILIKRIKKLHSLGDKIVQYIQGDQNKRLFLKWHILDLILRRIFFAKIFWNLVFKLQKEIISVLRACKGDGQKLTVRRERFTRGPHTNQTHSHIYKNTFLLFFPLYYIFLSVTYFKYANFIKLWIRMMKLKWILNPLNIGLFYNYIDKIVREMS